MGNTLATLQPGSSYNTEAASIALQPNPITAKQQIRLVSVKKDLKHLSLLVDELSCQGNETEKQTTAKNLRNCLKNVRLVRKKKRGPLTLEQIFDYVNTTQEDAHKFGIQVTKVFHITQNHEPDFASFCKLNGIAKGKPRMMLWHGTQLGHVPSILQNGFTLPTYNERNRRLQGQGIYFADRVTKSARYCDRSLQPNVGDKACLLLCDIFMGNTFYAVQPDHFRSNEPNNYNSVACEGRYVPDPENIKVVETDAEQGNLVLPLGKSVVNTKMNSYELQFNEFIVYNREQIKISYLIFFKFTKAKHLNCIENNFK